jgi:DNA-dependent protein kinase catalytic subunit
MADRLSSLLQNLLALVQSTSAQRAHEGRSVASDITQICMESLSESELAYCSSVLFKEGGILTFLKNSAGIDEFAVCKEELLHLVESYVCKMGKKFLSYVKPVKDVCVSLFTRERISRVKVATFGPLIAVVQLCQHSTLKEDLEIGKIVEKYFLACTQPSKHTATVKSGIYQLLGTLAEVFPEKTEAYAPRLIDVYLSNLKQEMDPKKSKKPEMLVISGCLKGLGGLLVNFPPTDPKVLADIFHFTRKAIDPQVSLARYDVPKGGLMLLARHASLFRGYLTKDHQNVYAVMFKWCNHHNKDMKSAGLDALDAFLQQVAQHLLEGGRGNAASTAVFKTFITIFQELIDAPSTGTREMSVVVRGYGYFAAPCRMLLKDQDVKFMFDQVIKRSEYLLISGCELLEEKIYHLPSFLTSLASIVNEIVDVTGDFLGSLERLVVLLFEHFPRLGPAIRFSAYKAMNILLATLAQKGALLKALVSNIVYQGLIRTCSHPVSLQGMITRPVQSTDESQASYNDYVELWFHIMKPQRKEEQAVSQLTPDQRQYLYATLYDALIQSVLKVAHKLDLSATKAPRLPDKVEDGEKKETEPVVLVSDPTASLQPAVVKDFQVFINLVDFCRTVLPAVEPHNFRRWVYLFSCDIISMSAKQPLVSGFYKMLATGLTICSKIHYFQPDEGQLMGSQELMETDAVDDTERGLCFTLFRKFIKETLEKLKQYKDDLQASCLLLILSAPKEFVEIDVIPIVTAVQIALNLGISYMPLAEAAISALESWTSQLPPDVFKPHLPTILPCLDTYLQSAAETELYSEEAKDVVTLRSHPSARSHGTGKLPIKVLKALKEGMASSETPLHKLRLRIVQFLGSLGGEYNIGLVDSSDSQSLESAIAWDTAKHLDFSMPFNDMKLSIYLDPFLPRVTELALSASDRQTKVAACELLHSMTLFLIGKGAIQPDWAKSKSPMIVLYKRLFPTLMRLACDVEQVAVQLFRPLMFQIIHWFTGNKMYECPETVVLLEAMMDCVVDSNSGSLRDFGAECVREFLQWSIKQTTPKELEKRPHNVKSLLLRLQSLSQHPNPFKRLGSAIAFNNIYTIFREEESVIDLFVLELLVNFVYSLRMAHKDDESLGTQEQCKQVIIHLERMVKVKSHVLLKVNKDRRKPRGFREASIGHLIEWLLSQCGRPETEARHMCMRLFCSLVPNAFDQDTPSNWMQKTLKHLSADYLNKKFETAGGRGGIWKYSTALILTEVFSLDQIISWLGDLLAALDCYTWVLGERLLRLTEILSVSGKTKYESQLFTALSWFVNGLAWGGIEDAQKWFAQHDVGVQEVFTPMEVEQYNRAKCTLTVRLFDFLIICLGGYPAESVKVIPSNFFGPKLCELVVECVLNPSSVGFDLFDVEVVEHLPSKMVQLCSSLVRFLKESDCFSVFSKVLFTRLRNNNFSDVVPNILVDENVSWKLHQTVSGFRQLNKAGLLQSAWSDKIPFSQLGNFLLDAVMSSVRPEMGSSSPRLLSPSTLSTYKQILLLALDVGVQVCT